LAQKPEALRESTPTVRATSYSRRSPIPATAEAGLERSNMDRVRDLVAARCVPVVLAWECDKIAQEPAYLLYLREEFVEHGPKSGSSTTVATGAPKGS
jgi:hypothetical protein